MQGGAGLSQQHVLRTAGVQTEPTSHRVPSVSLKVTSDKYDPMRSSVNGSGFRPFDMVIPFSFRKGEITGETRPLSSRV